ncbi:unnamed protein product [Peniophora sp. CBMAI 1063]|nr:unnamed protein product [Peniophora sp. CBMAI 1063]
MASTSTPDPESLNIVALPPAPAIPTQPRHTYDAGAKAHHTPIVIDNGSSTLRFGWAGWADPICAQNAVSRFKERRQGKQLLLFGEAIDAESGARAQSKQPWEGDVLVNPDALESAFDYVFTSLGLDTPAVAHPLLLSERLCSPLYSRALTSELLFELYGAPSVLYAVDAPMSLYHNHLPPTPIAPFSMNALVVSFNTASTSVIPVVSGRGIMSAARRLPFGAQQANEYLLKLVQLKYPSFGTRVTPAQTNWMLRTQCAVATDYRELMRRLADPLEMRRSEVVVQFPYAVAVEKSEEEKARLTERRKEQGRKLQEMAAKARADKLAKTEEALRVLEELKAQKAEVPRKEWNEMLADEDFDNEEELEAAIRKLDADVKKARKKDMQGEPMDEDVQGEPSFPLVDTPDAELDEEGLKEKRRQKLMKAGYEARVRARKEKEREREEVEAKERAEAEERERDLAGWAGKLRAEHESIMNKIKERNRRRAALGDRKSAAAQARMKSIASLAADERVPKKRRKGNGEDMFGADDSDWAIYRKINTAAPSSDEEDDLTTLATLESKLLAHDPTFTPTQTHASLSTARSLLLSTFRPLYNEDDARGAMRIHLSTERWRAVEPWFAPGMAGVDAAGLAELAGNVLGMFAPDVRARLASTVFLTGGAAGIPGMGERLAEELRSGLPVGSALRVVRAQDPSADAWRGMAAFAQTPAFGGVGEKDGSRHIHWRLSFMAEEQSPWLPLVRARFSASALEGIDRRFHLQTLDLEYESMRQALFVASRMRNQSAGPCRLPPELLTQIFAEAQSDWEPRRRAFKTSSGDDIDEDFYSGWMAITHVCSLWREVALNDPMLWSRPEYEIIDIHPDYVPVIISRCRGNPIRLHVNLAELVDIDETTVKDDASYQAWIFPDVLSQACDLTLIGENELIEDVMANLPETMPRLRQLYIGTSSHHGPNPILPQRAWELAGVTKLELWNYSLPWNAPIFSSSMTCLTLFSYTGSPRYSFTEAQLMLSHLPALKKLDLYNIVPFQSRGEDGGSTITLPPLLRELRIAVSLPNLIGDGLALMAGVRASSPCSFDFTIRGNHNLFTDPDNPPSSLDGVLRQLGFPDNPHPAAQSLVFNLDSIQVACLDLPPPGYAVAKSLCISVPYDLGLSADYARIWHHLIKVLDCMKPREVKALTFSWGVIDTLASSDMWKRLLLAVNVDRIDIAVGPNPTGSMHLGILRNALCEAYSSPSATSSPSQYPFPRLASLVLHLPKHRPDDAFLWVNTLIDLVDTRAALGVPLGEIAITSDSSFESTEWDRLGAVIKLVLPK